MAGISDAVPFDAIAKITGWKIEKGEPAVDGTNLPQRIAILGCANTANESTAPTVATQVRSAIEAGTKYGYGSPVHQIMRVLRPQTSDGVGGIPTYVYRQTEPSGAVAAQRKIAVVTAGVTSNRTHSVVINGRDGLDGQTYEFTVLTTDTADDIATKIAATINGVLGTPVTAVVNVTNTDEVDLTAKYAGSISNELTVTVDVREQGAGVSYNITETTAGVGDHVIGSPFTDEAWNTIVINPYTFAAALDRLEAINGIPDPDTPTGNYSGIAFRPFKALFGNTSKTVTDLTTITSTRKNQVTNCICPSPGSVATTWESAANYAYRLAIQAQNDPHLDIAGKSLPDMPIPADGDIGDFVDYSNRDFAVKNGSGTAIIKNDAYEVQDFLTTYHPDGEVPPQFRWARSLVQDFNVQYGYRLREQLYVENKAIANNDQTVTVADVIKPKQWIQVLNSYADDLAVRAIIVDADFMKQSIQVSTGQTNPDRLETRFRYRRSPFTRIASTNAEANFIFGLTE